MSPNGRRAWRKWLKSQRKHDKDSWAANIGACLGRAAYARRHRGTDAGQGLPDVVPTVSATPFTARSLVGMTMGARKRKRWDMVQIAGQYDAPGAARYIGVLYRIGERLRPCPGCCACWGHRISSAYGEIAECCGPQTSGKRKSQIKAMRKWQETLADNCDGSGVLPARRS